MNLKRKVELLFLELLKPLTKIGKPLQGVNIDGAHRDGERILPALELWAGMAQERDDIHPGSGEFNVTLTINLLTQADDNTREMEDSRITAIIQRLCDDNEIKLEANYPNSKRPVPDLFIQAVYEGLRDSSADERTFVEEMEYTVVCRDDDGQVS